MTVNEVHFRVKSRTRLMGPWCTMSAHKLKSETSTIKHTLFWGSRGCLTYFAAAHESLRPVKQEEMADFWTLGGWVSSSFLINPPTADRLLHCSMNEQLSARNWSWLNLSACAFIRINADVIWRTTLKERSCPDIDDWELYSGEAAGIGLTA